MKKETRNELIKSTSIIAIDTVISVSMPYLMPAWSLSKHMYEAGMKLRIKKVVEWVEMIQNNPGTFTKEVLQTEAFQDGFAYALEQYIRERNQEKRQYYRNIFCNFADAKSKEDFELERFYTTLTMLDMNSITVLTQIKRNYATGILFSQPFQVSTDMVTGDVREGVFTLINAGILVLDTTMRLEGDTTRMTFGLAQDNVSLKSPFLYMTGFGSRFVDFIMYMYEK